MRNLTFLSALLLLIACTKDEAEPSPQIIDNGGLHALDGEWHLSNVLTLAPQESYDLGEYVWDIDIDNESVTVDDNSDDLGYYMIGEGTYSLTITEDSLFVNGIGLGLFTDDDELNLSNMPELDGPIHFFIREE